MSSSASRIARRYSKALANLCDKDKSHEATARDLDKLIKALDTAAEVEGALSNPAINASTKLKVIESIAKSLVLRPLTQNFLMFLAEKQRLNELRDIVLDFHERIDEVSGRLRAEVVAAKPLTTLEKQRIRTALEKATGKSVVLEATVDPALIGGVVAKIGNIVLDGSVRSALDKMKARLHEAVQ